MSQVLSLCRPLVRPSLPCLLSSRPLLTGGIGADSVLSWQMEIMLSFGHQQAAVTMIDGLMTELCKSFNPFIKLDGWTGGKRGGKRGVDFTWRNLSSHLSLSGFCEGTSDAPSRYDTQSWETLQHVWSQNIESRRCLCTLIFALKILFHNWPQDFSWDGSNP